MACYPGEDYDVSGVLLTEEGERRFDEVDLAEKGDFELVAHEVLGREAGRELFDGADDRYPKLAFAFASEIWIWRLYLLMCSRAEYQYVQTPPPLPLQQLRIVP